MAAASGTGPPACLAAALTTRRARATGSAARASASSRAVPAPRVVGAPSGRVAHGGSGGAWLSTPPRQGGGQGVGDQLVEPVALVGGQGGGAGQGPGRPRAQLLQQGEQPLADPVAQGAVAGVGRVLAPFQADGGAAGPGLGPADAEQGPEQTAAADGHAGQAVRACPPQQLQQHRLGLVVEGVAGGQPAAAELVGGRPQGAVPGRPGRALGAGLAVLAQVGGGEGADPGGEAEGLGMVGHEGGVGRRARPQPVVDGDHGQPPAARAGQGPQGVEQGQGVGAPGDGDRDPVAGRRHPGRGQGLGGPVGDQAQLGRGPGHGPASRNGRGSGPQVIATAHATWNGRGSVRGRGPRPWSGGRPARRRPG